MIQTGKELALRCIHTADNFKTLYVLGCFGWPMHYENQQRAIRSYVFNADVARSAKIHSTTPSTFGFDCICFVKALLWGWVGDVDKEYGGAIYESNGVADISESQMLGVCKDVSEDFSEIQVGEFLWTDGHCGIYVGDGIAVECTYRWSDGVQKTAVYNITGQNQQKGRYWKKHGKLPYIQYEETCKKRRNMYKGCKGADVKAIQILLIGNGYDCGSCGADGDFGDKTNSAVLAYQGEHGLDKDGIVGVRTLCSLLGVDSLE